MTQEEQEQNSDGGNSGNDGALDPHTREGAAAAGDYNAPGGAPPLPEEGVGTQPDMAAVDENDTNTDGDRITSQQGREAAGPFTGTGNQDALRTAGTPGGSDPHHADERVSGDESAVAGARGSEEEGQAADADASGEGDETDGEPPAAA